MNLNLLVYLAVSNIFLLKICDSSIKNYNHTIDYVEDSTTKSKRNISQLGLFHTNVELKIWRSRINKGIYVNKGDVDVNTPGDWNRIMQNAKSFMSNPVQERITKTHIQGGYVHPKMIKLRDAAFYALIKNDDDIFNTVKSEILWMCTKSGVQYSEYDYHNTDKGNWWDAEWLLRLLIAYDYTKGHFNEEERSIVKNWFLKAAKSFAYSVNKELEMNFPDRLNRNYSVRKRAAVSREYGNTIIKHAYIDKNGKYHNYIPTLAKWYNNRKSMEVGFFGLTGILFDDYNLTDQAKLYIEEWIKYSMFPDGTTGEYQRNGDYEYSSAGRHYNAINIQTAVLIADALARKGDFSLYNYKTSEGLWGTEGGEKSILTAVMNYLYELDYTVERFCDDEDCLQGDQKLSPANRIDAIADRGRQKGKQWVNEIFFAPIGNQFWKRSRISDGYLRKTPNSPAYGNDIGTAGPTGPPWGGAGYIFPGILFMYGQMENQIWPYPDITS